MRVIVAIVLCVGVLLACQSESRELLSVTEAWNIINAVKEIKSLEDPNMKMGTKC
jgi:hypothetical protein